MISIFNSGSFNTTFISFLDLVAYISPLTASFNHTLRLMLTYFIAIANGKKSQDHVLTELRTALMIWKLPK